jgi:hypothetical protein
LLSILTAIRWLPAFVFSDWASIAGRGPLRTGKSRQMDLRALIY